MSYPYPSSRYKESYIWRILLIDDDEDDYVLVRQMLAQAREWKFTLEWASTFDTGRQTLLSDRSFDAVLVDYDMGTHTGTELIREAVTREYPAPLLLLTGRGTYEVDVEAMQAGAADYLSKGEINAVFLERAIRYAIERTRAENELRKSEQRFRAIFENRHSVMLLVDPTTAQIVDANEAACTFYGWSKEMLLGMKISDINTLPRDQLLARMGQAHTTQTSMQFHFQHRLASGEIRDVEVRSGPVQIGEKQLLFSIINDISELVKTQADLQKNEAELRETNERLNYALQAAALGIWSVDLQGNHFYADEVAKRMHGFGPDEVLNNRDFANRYMHPEDLAQNEAVFQKAVHEGIFEMEYRVLLPSGEVRWIFSFGGFDAQHSRLHGVVMDITRRKRIYDELQRSEAELRLSEERERARANELATLMDAVPAMIWISRDNEAREVIGNRFGNEFLRMRQGANISESAPAEALQEQPYRSFRNGDEIPPDELPLQVASATGQPARDYDFDMVFNDGAVYHLIGNVDPLFDYNGMPCGAVGAFIDITRLRILESQQIEAKAQMEIQRRLMEQREKERQAIARDIHDGPIQTLSSTAFHLQMIKEVFTDPALLLELNQVTLDVKNSVQELRAVINELRPPTLMHFGLSRVIRMYTQDMRDQHPQIEFNLDVMDDAKILSDQACLSLFRIYQSGINNILKHSGATTVWVTYKIEPASFTFELRDNGIGFEFSRDFDRLTRDGHFGLVGMKERAESIGGEFSVYSEPGKGTRIVIKGPLLGKNLK